MVTFFSRSLLQLCLQSVFQAERGFLHIFYYTRKSFHFILFNTAPAKALFCYRDFIQERKRLTVSDNQFNICVTLFCNRSQQSRRWSELAPSVRYPSVSTDAITKHHQCQLVLTLACFAVATQHFETLMIYFIIFFKA